MYWFKQLVHNHRYDRSGLLPMNNPWVLCPRNCPALNAWQERGADR